MLVSIKVPVLCAAVGGLSALTAFGATFNHVDGNYDVADSAAWGGKDKMPSTTEAIYFCDANATYTMSADMTFGYPYPKAANMTFDFSATPERKVTLTHASQFTYPYYATVSMIFKGGTWVANGGKATICQDGVTASNYWRLEGGVMVTNVGSVALKQAGNVNSTVSLVIKEASKLYSKSDLGNRYMGPQTYRLDGDPTAVGVGIDISGGSLVRFGGQANLGGSAVLVRGTNTQLIVKGTLAPSSSGDSDGILHVTDAATVEAKTLVIGGSPLSTNGLVCIDNCSTGRFTTVCQGSTGSNVSYGRGHRMIVGTDGYAETTDTHYLRGTNSVLVVSNGTYRVKDWTIGNNATDRDHEVILTGSQASFAWTDTQTSLFKTGRGHRFELRNDADFTWRGNLYMGNSRSISNTLAVVGSGSVFGCTGSFFLNAYQSGSQGGIGNEIRVADGALLACTNKFTVTGSDNRVILSNGTLRVYAKDANTFFMMGDANSVSATTNNALVFEGTTPLLNVNRAAYFKNGSRIVWRLPVEGYPAGHATLLTDSITLNDDTELDFEGLDELRANLDPKSATYTLMSSFGRSGYMPSATAPVIVRANAKLAAKGCSITVTPDEKKILLTVTSTKPRGFIMFVR